MSAHKNFREILGLMIEKNVSDLFIRVASSLKGRVYTRIETIDENVFSIEDVERIVDEITKVNHKEELKLRQSCEFAFWFKENWRFRIGIFYQRNTPSIVVRKVDLQVPSFEQLGLPAQVMHDFCSQRRGLILMTGITGSGKSTAIAAMLEEINKQYARHILTVEDPIEFTFIDKKSIINQREIGLDVGSYEAALKQFTVHSPDVIYMGDIRDAQACYVAVTAAETGILVFSTLHTINAASTVERIVNFYPPHQHGFVFNQLSFLLKGVISLRLVPRIDGKGMVPAYEVMTLSPSVSRLLRENKIWEIPKYISSGGVYGMKSFHQSLVELVEAKKISSAAALEYADRREELEMELRTKNLM